MKILLIGFHRYGKEMYPHLKCFIDHASKNGDLGYFHMRERGYFAKDVQQSGFGLRALAIILRTLLLTAVDAVVLWRKHRDSDTVIAIDHFAYAVACRLFPRKQVILWSFDIIGDDSPLHGSALAQTFMKPCGRALARHRRVIIQDRDRLVHLARSLGVDPQELDAYFMPVSLDDPGAAPRNLSSRARPRLMQSGGIGKYRSSDRLLAHYQVHHGEYRLYFHGFVFPEIVRQLDSMQFQPMVSTRTLAPEQMAQLTDFADIGFISYEDEQSQNFHLLAHASGQLVEFIRNGIPVVVMGQNNLQHFCEDNGIGLGIADFDGLAGAMRTIVDSYPDYSNRCLNCFENNFSMDKLGPRLLAWL